MCNEYSDDELRSESVLKSTLHAILHIVTRNVNFVSFKNSGSKIQDMINYIHYYIHDSEKLSNRVLASKFYVSENYMSEYFKREMGIGLKKYILNYKVKLAQTRLKYTNLTVTEIAQELGFTDSSHLDKTFIAYQGVTAGAYRIAAKLK